MLLRATPNCRAGPLFPHVSQFLVGRKGDRSIQVKHFSASVENSSHMGSVSL